MTSPTRHLSHRCQDIQQSYIRRMSIECARVGGVNLSQGVCDLEVPPVVRQAVKDAVEEGYQIYTRFDGLESLRHEIARKLERDATGLTADPEHEIVVTVGATGAFFSAAMALLNPGDDVILFEPFYGYHRNCLKALDVTSTLVATTPPDWSFRIEDVEAAITPKTRGLMVCTPSNPTGKVYTRAELEALAELAEKHDLIVFTDEIYEYFLYDGREHISMATLPGMRERTVTISGFSKTFAITGWRIGYLVAQPEWARAMRYCSDIAYVCAPSLLQEAVARGLRALPPSYYTDIRDDHAAKREKICSALTDAGLPPIVPQGSYYVLADVSRLPGEDSVARVMHLLEESKVAAVPGAAFFRDPADAAHLARFCYAKKDADLDRACAALRSLA